MQARGASVSGMGLGLGLPTIGVYHTRPTVFFLTLECGGGWHFLTAQSSQESREPAVTD